MHVTKNKVNQGSLLNPPLNPLLNPLLNPPLIGSLSPFQNILISIMKPI